MKWSQVLDSVWVHQLWASLLYFAAMMALQSYLSRRLTQLEQYPIEMRRRFVVYARNAIFFMLVTGLVLIWASQLQAIAASLVVFAAAIVLALKELILCLTGAILRTVSKSYGVGDRIEFGSIRGDVIDVSLMSTKVLEIGPGQMSHRHTGRAITIPNSVLLNQSVINETFMGDFVVHTMVVPLKPEDDIARAEKTLLEAAQAECAPFIEDARKHMKALETTHSLDAPSVDPAINLQMPEPKRVNLLLRFPAPVRRKGRIEQAILRRFLSAANGQKS